MLFKLDESIACVTSITVCILNDIHAWNGLKAGHCLVEFWALDEQRDIVQRFIEHVAWCSGLMDSLGGVMRNRSAGTSGILTPSDD